MKGGRGLEHNSEYSHLSGIHEAVGLNTHTRETETGIRNSMIGKRSGEKMESSYIARKNIKWKPAR